jgi:hypothetical protein
LATHPPAGYGGGILAVLATEEIEDVTTDDLGDDDSAGVNVGGTFLSLAVVLASTLVLLVAKHT